jgi:hemin uptake protein HemP
MQILTQTSGTPMKPSDHVKRSTTPSNPMSDITLDQKKSESAPDRTVPFVRSSDLFGSSNEIEIEHGDSRYRLRKTLLGKLIMTK